MTVREIRETIKNLGGQPYKYTTKGEMEIYLKQLTDEQQPTIKAWVDESFKTTDTKQGDTASELVEIGASIRRNTRLYHSPNCPKKHEKTYIVLIKALQALEKALKAGEGIADARVAVDEAFEAKDRL